ncbi:hypothetical protein [Francisella-like endosymbiont]|uniref:hypothetical protein n=1 Tax=Francisella-like endosymbiont TaxID=512373 RepID=UPI0031CCB249
MAVTCFHLFLTAEILISNYVGLLFEVTANWRGMFLSALVPQKQYFLLTQFFM